MMARVQRRPRGRPRQRATRPASKVCACTTVDGCRPHSRRSGRATAKGSPRRSDTSSDAPSNPCARAINLLQPAGGTNREIRRREPTAIEPSPHRFEIRRPLRRIDEVDDVHHRAKQVAFAIAAGQGAALRRLDARATLRRFAFLRSKSHADGAVVLALLLSFPSLGHRSRRSRPRRRQRRGMEIRGPTCCAIAPPATTSSASAAPSAGARSAGGAGRRRAPAVPRQVLRLRHLHACCSSTSSIRSASSPS